MSKGEQRKSRKAARAAGQPWNVELNDSGQPVVARTRTPRQERRHRTTMDRWARRYDALNGAPESEDDR